MVDKIAGSQDNFTLARYKQELAKPYSNVDLYVCKEADFKEDGEMNDRGLRIGKAYNQHTPQTITAHLIDQCSILHTLHMQVIFTFLPLKPVHRSPIRKLRPMLLILPEN